MIYKPTTLQELYSIPSRWTKGYFARDSEGHPLSYYRDEKATCYCLTGGVMYLHGDGTPEYWRVTNLIDKYLEDSGEYYRLSLKGHSTCIAIWNDYEATIEKIQQLVKELDI